MRPLQIPGLGQITSCIKCGACCRSSSPDLYNTDRHLLERGSIPLKYLFTMREGEPIKNPKTRQLDHLKTDIIKIRTIDNVVPSCFFFDDETQECGIYQTRPSICRAFKCWDKIQVEPVRSSPFLTRKDILSELPLWEIIEEHQAKCDYRKVRELSEQVHEDKNTDAGKEIGTMIAFDKSVRDLATEKGKMDPEIMNFLFGREIEESLSLFKLKLDSGKDGRRILTTI